MKVYQQNEVKAVLKINQINCLRDPENFVPFGWEGFNKKQIEMFDAEMDKFYNQMTFNR